MKNSMTIVTETYNNCSGFNWSKEKEKKVIILVFIFEAILNEENIKSYSGNLHSININHFHLVKNVQPFNKNEEIMENNGRYLY